MKKTTSVEMNQAEFVQWVLLRSKKEKFEGECIEWPFEVNDAGFPVFDKSDTEPVMRALFEALGVKIPDDPNWVIVRDCDRTPTCVNCFHSHGEIAKPKLPLSKWVWR